MDYTDSKKMGSIETVSCSRWVDRMGRTSLESARMLSLQEHPRRTLCILPSAFAFTLSAVENMRKDCVSHVKDGCCSAFHRHSGGSSLPQSIVNDEPVRFGPGRTNRLYTESTHE